MNKSMIIGNLTKDTELTQSGETKICRFTVAVGRKFTRDDSKQADFFRVTVFNKLAENCNKYLAKGKKVCVVGRLEINEYTDKQGEQRQSVDIIAEEVEFLSPATESAPPSFKDRLEPIQDNSLPF